MQNEVSDRHGYSIFSSRNWLAYTEILKFTDERKSNPIPNKNKRSSNGNKQINIHSGQTLKSMNLITGHLSIFILF